MRRPMALDLVALGDQLEAATERAVARRRARRQVILNAAASIVIAVPIGLAAVTADLNRAASNRPTVGESRAQPALAWTPGYDLAVSHIPDERVTNRPTLPRQLLKIDPNLRPAVLP